MTLFMSLLPFIASFVRSSDSSRFPSLVTLFFVHAMCCLCLVCWLMFGIGARCPLRFIFPRKNVLAYVGNVFIIMLVLVARFAR